MCLNDRTKTRRQRARERERERERERRHRERRHRERRERERERRQRARGRRHKERREREREIDLQQRLLTRDLWRYVWIYHYHKIDHERGTSRFLHHVCLCPLTRPLAHPNDAHFRQKLLASLRGRVTLMLP